MGDQALRETRFIQSGYLVMSRIGKQPVVLPQKVKAAVVGSVVSIEGPLGKMDYVPGAGVSVVCQDGKLVVSNLGQDKQARANYGTTRARLNNIVHGVAQGWKRSLEITGVGYTAKLQGPKLMLTVGFSHDVALDIPTAVKCVVNKNIIELQSCDKELLGTFASRIRRVQPPEPYLGKGIKYSEEKIRRKAGKAGKK